MIQEKISKLFQFVFSVLNISLVIMTNGKVGNDVCSAQY